MKNSTKDTGRVRSIHSKKEIDLPVRLLKKPMAITFGGDPMGVVLPPIVAA